MVSRHFIIFCLIVLFATFANIKAEDEPQQSKQKYSEASFELDDVKLQELENRNIIDVIMKILEEAFGWAAKNCLREVARQCKEHWARPKDLIQCAKDYFKENHADCAIPIIKLN